MLSLMWFTAAVKRFDNAALFPETGSQSALSFALMSETFMLVSKSERRINKSRILSEF